MNDPNVATGLSSDEMAPPEVAALAMHSAQVAAAIGPGNTSVALLAIAIDLARAAGATKSDYLETVAETWDTVESLGGCTSAGGDA